MARKSLKLLIEQEQTDKFETELRTAAINAANAVMRKIVSRQEWMNNRQKQINTLEEIYAKLERAYQRGDLPLIKKLTSELSSYVEAYNIDELLQRGELQITEMTGSFSGHTEYKMESRTPLKELIEFFNFRN